MKHITAKLMHEKLKQGWTSSDFANHLECSEEEFWDLFQKNFSGTAYENFCRELRSNEKARNKAKRNALARIHVVDSDNIEDTSVSADDTPSEIDLLTSLEQEKKAIEEKCSKLTQDGQTLSKTLDDIIQQINAQSTFVENLRRQLSNEENILSSLEQSKKSLNSELADIVAAVTNLNIHKANIQARINLLKKVTIFVYSDGSVELSKDSSYELVDAPETFKELLNTEELEVLTIKQLKSLAKVISLIRKLKENGNKFEISFENEICENFFEKTFS